MVLQRLTNKVKKLSVPKTKPPPTRTPFVLPACRDRPAGQAHRNAWQAGEEVPVLEAEAEAAPLVEIESEAETRAPEATATANPNSPKKKNAKKKKKKNAEK